MDLRYTAGYVYPQTDRDWDDPPWIALIAPCFWGLMQTAMPHTQAIETLAHMLSIHPSTVSAAVTIDNPEQLNPLPTHARRKTGSLVVSWPAGTGRRFASTLYLHDVDVVAL